MGMFSTAYTCVSRLRRAAGAVMLASSLAYGQPSMVLDFSQGADYDQRLPNALSFTRATPATITDFEGLIKSCLSGELRIYGARRVRNLATTAISGWTLSQVTRASGVADPIGGTGAYTLTAASAGGTMEAYDNTLGTPASGTQIRNTLYMRRRTGSGQISLHNGVAYEAVTLTSSWQRIAAGVGTTVGGQIYIAVKFAVDTDAVDIYLPQTENVTGQSNQNPGEPVLTGLSAPYHGYFADGVKYFNYENGNTVSSNVVTEAQGAAITGTMGYLTEGQRTNLCLQSQTFGTTWIVGSSASIVSNTTAAPDGTTTADSFVTTDTSANAHLYQAFTPLTAAVHAESIYIKAGTTTAVTLFLATSGSALGASVPINLSDGTVGAITHYGASNDFTATISPAANGFYRITLKGTTTAADWYFQVNGNEAGTCYLWGAQLEQASFASSYIPTTTAAVTRNADVLTCPSAGIVSSNCTVTLEVAALPPAFATNGRLIEIASDEPNRQGVYVQPSGIPLVYSNVSGINTATVTGTTDLRGDTLAKIGVVMASNDVRLCVNGAMEGTPDTSCDIPATTTIYFGAYMGGTGFEPYCCFVSVRIYKNKLSNAQLQALTS